jgi:sigma-54 dependent transcriptional regulator, acetoin dehydrogenase operon transcriptional activator AcoR
MASQLARSGETRDRTGRGLVPKTGGLRDSCNDSFPYHGRMVIQALNTSDQYEGEGVDALRAELARVSTGDAPSLLVRAQIVDSWRRSVAHGLVPERFDPLYDGSIQHDSLLMRAAKPVVDELAANLAFAQIGVVLTGAGGRVALRRVASPRQQAQLDELMLAPGYHWDIEHAGTNGMGGAIVNRSPLLVVGGEHFADALMAIATAGAPVHDPRSGRLLGTLGLVCSVEAANPLLLPMVTQAAREAEQRLLNGYSRPDRLLEESFVDARRRTRGPIAAVSGGALVTNAAAARLLAATDHKRLWDFASRSLGNTGTIDLPFILADGRVVSLTVEAILDGGAVAGALIRFRTDRDAPSSRRKVKSSGSGRPSYGWESLTEAEHSVTDLVADGLTNRQVATKLFVSPHTVDSHLRHIFRKLDISSRLDLVRIVTTRSVSNRGLVGTADVA